MRDSLTRPKRGHEKITKPNETERSRGEDAAGGGGGGGVGGRRRVLLGILAGGVPPGSPKS